MGEITLLSQIATLTKSILQQLETHILNAALIEIDRLQILGSVTLRLDQVRDRLSSLIPDWVTLQA